MNERRGHFFIRSFSFLLLAMFFAGGSNVALAFSISPTTVYYNTPVTFVTGVNEGFAYFYPNGNFVTATDSTTVPWYSVILSPSDPVGTYHFLLVDLTITDCDGLTYSQCMASPAYLGTDIPVLYLAPAVVAGGVSVFTSTSTANLLAGVGLISSSTFGSIFPYLMLSIGVFVSFYIIQQIIFAVNQDKKKNKDKR